MKKIFIFPIKLYRIFISPIIGGHNCCRFTPTCSAYGIEAIEKLGVVKGIVKTLHRIIRCNPWGGSGYDPVKNEQHRNFKIN